MKKLSRLKYFLITICCWCVGIALLLAGGVIYQITREGVGLFISGMAFLGAGWFMEDCSIQRLNDIGCKTRWIRFVVSVVSFLFIAFPFPALALALFKSKIDTEESKSQSFDSSNADVLITNSLDSLSFQVKPITLGINTPCRRVLLILLILYLLFGVALFLNYDNWSWVYDTPEQVVILEYFIFLFVLLLFIFGIGQLILYKPFKRLLWWIRTGK